MRKYLKIIIIVFIVLLVRSISIFAINERIISNYNKQIYNNTLLVNFLYLLTFNNSYIVYYNDGNLLYNQNLYEEAIKKYDASLSKHPSQKRVCDIRINKSLAMVALVNPDNKKQALNKLREARYNLYENGCVDPEYFDSYSLDAEKLEQEIKELEQELQEQEERQENEDDKQDNDDQEEDEYQQIEEQIRENERRANESRQEQLNQDNNFSNYEYYPGRNW